MGIKYVGSRDAAKHCTMHKSCSLSKVSRPATERRSSCLLLRKPVLERQVLMQRKLVYLQVLASWKMGTHVTKPISWEDGGLTSQSPSPPLSAGRGFY